MNRRDFLNGILALAGGVPPARVGATQGATGTFSYYPATLLRPPGARVEFEAWCVNCYLCAAACHLNCIRFFDTSDDSRIVPRTPYIIPREKGCDLCLECIPVCPTGALLPVADMRDVTMGIAEIDERLCLPYINQGVCGACYTVCPVNAVSVEMQRHVKVIEEKCVGCGLCEEVCLQKVRAIRVKKPKPRRAAS